MLNRLNPAQDKAAGPGIRADGGGFWLYKGRDGGAKWVLRYTAFGCRHEMGLGPYPTVTLKDAVRCGSNERRLCRSISR